MLCQDRAKKILSKKTQVGNVQLGKTNGPQEKIGYIGHTFAFYATKMGSRDSGETKVGPHWLKDLPWSFNGPCHGPTIHPTWPFIYYRTRLGPSMDPAWPYNTPNMALYILDNLKLMF